MKLAYIIPVFGEHDYTDAILRDLLAQDHSNDIFVIDNKGDYDEDRVREEYRSSHSNLEVIDGDERRWLKGTNYGTSVAAQVNRTYGCEYGAYVWLNNDTRISPEFSSGISASLEALGSLCGLLAPSYDDVWPQQHCGHRGPAADFRGVEFEKEVRFVDGACMVVPTATWEKIGPMDERFWQFGWGGDLDYCLRVREAGLGVFVTQRAYFNHLGGGTNKLLEENYHGEAGSEMHTNMLAKYGPGWEELLR
jgi:GT2 family glycosyltransferase